MGWEQFMLPRERPDQPDELRGRSRALSQVEAQCVLAPAVQNVQAIQAWV